MYFVHRIMEIKSKFVYRALKIIALETDPLGG